MKKIIIIILSLLVFLSGCATNGRYGLDGDYNGMEPPEELTSEEQALKQSIFQDADVVETFSDSSLEEGFSLDTAGKIIADEGYLRSEFPGNSLHFESPEGRKMESIVIGWDLTSSQGHLIAWAEIRGFGTPTYFINPGQISAHIHLESLGGDTENLGAEEHTFLGYTIQEIRVDGDEVVLLYNGKEFTRYPLDKDRLINHLSIGNNLGGEGNIDFVVIKYGE